MIVSRSFTLHGVPIFTHATHPALDGAACTLLRAIATEAPRDTAPAVGLPSGISLHLSNGQAPALPPGARIWMAADPLCLLTDERDSFLLLDGQFLGALSPADRRINTWIPPTLLDAPDFIGQMIVLPLLLEGLRAGGFVSLHAAALAYNGRAALFPAASGAGKTTLTLALLRGGFQLLSDDCPLLRRNDAGITVYAFAEPLHVSAGTNVFFPEVPILAHRSPREVEATGAVSSHKVALDPTVVYGECVIQQCLPGAILFPSISQEDHTRLEPLATPEALLRVLALAMPSASRLHVRQQFDLLGDLVSMVPCYTLFTGRDFEHLPGLVRAALET